MTEPIAIDKQSPAYRQGFADGRAGSNNKMPYVARMWAGLGLFLFFTLIFAGVPMYRDYNDRLEHNARLEACATAADVPACVKALED